MCPCSAACAAVVTVDIVFLVDSSTTSVGTTKIRKIKSLLRSVVQALDIGLDRVRVGLAQYSHLTYQEFLLKDHTDKRSVSYSNVFTERSFINSFTFWANVNVTFFLSS